MKIAILRQVADHILAAPRGGVRSISGVEIEALIAACEAPPDGRRVLGFKINAAADVAGYLDQALAALAQAALRLWPQWWDGAAMPERDDWLGRQATRIIAERAARDVAGVSTAWAEAAARLALAGRAPRVRGYQRASEAYQLARAIAPAGLALVIGIGEPADTARADALVHALEGLARQLDASVTALFARLPAPEPPYDRILYGAHDFIEPESAFAPTAPEVWIAPARGSPHPMSDIEQRLSIAIIADPHLAPLFEFNRTLTTTRGMTPRVDLLWREGRLVVELDGYSSHGNRLSFQDDRHRDYELILSGYTILRLTNDEIADDLERAVEKIRDVVRVFQARM